MVAGVRCCCLLLMIGVIVVGFGFIDSCCCVLLSVFVVCGCCFELLF